jgi:DNA-directed RNA polymerase specialized sigma24 family protein
MLERLLGRDGRSIGDAIDAVRRVHPDATAEQLSAIAATLPVRAPRPRVVAIVEGDSGRFASIDSADSGAGAYDRARRSAHVSRIVREAMRSLSAEDRLILRLRFGKGSSIADIARALAAPQRPFYRRIEAMLAVLRAAVEREGLDLSSIEDLIGGSDQGLDFELAGKTDDAQPSLSGEGAEANR